jgi:phosphoribosylformylglycinamidine synthase
VRSGALHSAHDIAEGGLAVAIAECCIAGGVGATVELADVGERGLFAEAPGTAFVVSGSEPELRALDLPWLHVIGRVGGDSLEIAAGALGLKLPLSAVREAHAGGLGKWV